jgi:hypothetical protein
MSAEIIQLSTFTRPTRPVSDKRSPGQRMREAKPELPPTAPETAKNSRIRIERRDAWWHAGRVADYWRVRLDWCGALVTAQQYGIADSASFPSAKEEDRYGLLNTWREAVAKKLLTPAPDLAAITWKRALLASREFPHLPVKKERVECAIEEDVAFLAAHPTRRSNSEAIAHRREFKAAMRQRIRDIAASRDLSEDEIKPALSLKHQAIAQFSKQHGVNLEWLLEGKGRIFKKDPIRLGPNMTGSEFAAVVATLPAADQQAISTKMRELLQERDQ